MIILVAQLKRLYELYNMQLPTCLSKSLLCCPQRCALKGMLLGCCSRDWLVTDAHFSYVPPPHHHHWCCSCLTLQHQKISRISVTTWKCSMVVELLVQPHNTLWSMCLCEGRLTWRLREFHRQNIIQSLIACGASLLRSLLSTPTQTSSWCNPYHYPQSMPRGLMISVSFSRCKTRRGQTQMTLERTIVIVSWSLYEADTCWGSPYNIVVVNSFIFTLRKIHNLYRLYFLYSTAFAIQHDPLSGN